MVLFVADLRFSDTTVAALIVILIGIFIPLMSTVVYFQTVNLRYQVVMTDSNDLQHKLEKLMAVYLPIVHGKKFREGMEWYYVLELYRRFAMSCVIVLLQEYPVTQVSCCFESYHLCRIIYWLITEHSSAGW